MGINKHSNDYRTLDWYMNYNLLVDYYNKYKNVDVPKDYVINTHKLGVWVQYQRKSYKIGRLEREKILLLEKLGMKWTVFERSSDSTWDGNYELLKKYYDEHGNIDVPQRYKIDGINLGIWLANQRAAYKGKGERKISNERIELLNKLGMKWNAFEKTSVSTWNSNYKLVEDYYKQYGNIDISRSYTVNELHLGDWLSRQRQAYKKGTLDQEKILLLEKLGMKWEIQNLNNEENWNSNYKLVEDYYKQYGNLNISRGYTVNGYHIGYWLKTQREFYKKGKLDSERILLLEKLGIRWGDLNMRKWEDGYNLLLEYYNEHGNVDVPYSYEINGVKLGKWVSNQRQAYKGKGTFVLHDNQKELLNKLGMKWNMKSGRKIVTNIDDWKKNYKLVEDYYKENGNIDIPSCYVIGDVRLGAWLKKQRYIYKRTLKHGGKMPQEHIDLLNKLGMKWEKEEPVDNDINQRIKYAWKNCYRLLEEYYNENGNINVPVKYIIGDIDLGNWLTKQRFAYIGNSNETLNEEQIELLNKLGMKWSISAKERWHIHYGLLLKYHDKHGNIDVPVKYEMDGIKIGKWLHNLRQAYNGTSKNHKATEEQITLLNKLGMNWKLKPRKKWYQTYELLEEYYNEHGNCDISLKYEINGVKLGKWLHKQCQAYKGKSNIALTEEQIQLLEKLGVALSGRNDSKWNKNYKLLEEYYNEYGNIDVPFKYEVNGIKLGAWLRNLRYGYNGKIDRKLTEEQISLLNKLGMNWEIRSKKKKDSTSEEKSSKKTDKEEKDNDELWLSYYKLLENYYQTYGHSDVPQIYAINGIKLGTWVHNQRKTNLTSMQKYLLEKVNFKWDIETELDWKECLNLLNMYHKEHGDILVPTTYEKNGINLGLWLKEQRNMYRKNSDDLNPEVVKELNGLGFEWSKPITTKLNKRITNMKLYNENLIYRVNKVLRDLTLEGMNEINSEEQQKQITREMFSRIWR